MPPASPSMPAAEAQAEGSDVLLIDTAGRLQNKRELMAELEKIVRVLGKLDPGAPHAVLLVLDATTGQNALNSGRDLPQNGRRHRAGHDQAGRHRAGGILVGDRRAVRLPVHAIGIGEAVDDLQPFDAEAFSRAIAGLPRGLMSPEADTVKLGLVRWPSRAGHWLLSLSPIQGRHLRAPGSTWPRLPGPRRLWCLTRQVALAADRRPGLRAVFGRSRSGCRTTLSSR